MKTSVVERPAQHWVGYHLQGPWQETVPQGFAQLKVWAARHGLSGEWMAIYYGNPQELPPEELRVETVLTVPADYALAAGGDIQHGTLAGGHYFHTCTEVLNNDFFAAWNEFFAQLQARSDWQVDNRPCYEHYLSDGSQSGNWLLNMYIPVRPR
ncbi:DNA gyrase inhibitory protein [Pantoea sp. AS-PWVM4]|uniref:DNA gyrase inhibitor n=1 Tax=Pantoea phytobeneficialis TaxID=2052056 RepID=A0AAP9H760_9GAMM|nr:MULTISPECIES: GyrI-like domain-containing protein [Pantoea]ERK07394.1 DNA gyrase inhibitory protein [Pantoea sp. AS-PWVM4]MDO6405300.1 GyrI-like domain-containing protein [Pantoea phytobeneficialis]QGR07819.1 DNA gyrase inhibitor [Pantoea phytobeneficialis]